LRPFPEGLHQSQSQTCHVEGCALANSSMCQCIMWSVTQASITKLATDNSSREISNLRMLKASAHSTGGTRCVLLSRAWTSKLVPVEGHLARGQLLPHPKLGFILTWASNSMVPCMPGTRTQLHVEQHRHPETYLHVDPWSLHTQAHQLIHQVIRNICLCPLMSDH
jgi:hypothetical protein